MNFDGSLVITCLDTKKGCLYVQEATEGLCTLGKKIHRDEGQLAEGSPYVGWRCRRVHVKKALERRNPREAAFSFTLLLTLCVLAKNQGRPELGSSRPALRTHHGLHLWGTATKPHSRTDCFTEKTSSSL